MIIQKAEGPLMGFCLPQMGHGVPFYSFSYKHGITEYDENYAHVILDPT